MTDNLENGWQRTFTSGINNAQAGQLVFNPEAAEAGIKACGKVIDALTTALRNCDQLGHIAGMDGFLSSQSLRDNQLVPKGKASDPRSVQFALKQHKETAQKLMDLLHAAGNAFQDQEGTNAQSFDLNGAYAEATHKTK